MDYHLGFGCIISRCPVSISDRTGGDMTKYWIKKAVKGREGTLRRWAEKHRLMNKDGTIDLRAASAYNERHDSGKGRAIALAKRLRGYHK